MIASLTDQATPARVYPYCAPHTAEMIADLSRRAYEYRTQVLRMVYGRKSGHIGGAFSLASTFISFGSIPPIPNGKIEIVLSFQKDMPARCSTRALRIADSFRLRNYPPSAG